MTYGSATLIVHHGIHHFSVNYAKKTVIWALWEKEGALKSHANGDNHKDLVAAEESRLRFVTPRQRNPRHDEQSMDSKNIYQFVSKASSAEAEIQWTLFCDKHNFGDNSQKDFVPIIQTLFPDSKIAASLHLGAEKIGENCKVWAVSILQELSP